MKNPPSMQDPNVFIIILNTNRCIDTVACLESLQKSTYKKSHVIVLDNHSSDGSVDTIRSLFPTVQIIELIENLGYAGNNNVGILSAMQQGADWIFLLNEDTVVDPECLAHLIEVGESNRQIGVVGPMVYHHDEPNVIQSAGGMLGPYWKSIHLSKDEIDTGRWNNPHPVEWISGCAILVRSRAIEKAGMIDDRFFIYWEETEWCLRLSRAGWLIFHVPQAKIWHKGVQRGYKPQPSFTYYCTRNRLLMLAKHHAPFNTRVFTWIEIIRTLASWSIKPKWRSLHSHRSAMWRGILDFMFRRFGKMPTDPI